MKIPPKIFLILAVIWVAAGSVIFWARSNKPSPEKLAAYLNSDAVSGLSNTDEARRAEVIDRVAAQLNRLDFEQRRTLRADPALRQFFESLTQSERTAFLEKTLPEGFRQMINALNRMEPERRKKIVQRALDDVRRMDEGSASERGISDEDAQRFLTQGAGTFYEEASAEVKLEFAPVIEELQRNLQRFR